MMQKYVGQALVHSFELSFCVWIKKRIFNEFHNEFGSCV